MVCESSNTLDFRQAVCWTDVSSRPLAFPLMGKRRETPRVTAQHRRRQERLRALVNREKTQRAFADKYGLNHKHLSQMLATPGTKNWRGVGDDIVEKLETNAKLGLGSGYFDAIDVTEPLSAALAESHPKNSVRALRFAVQSLFSVLHETQQELAEAVAEDIVATAGTEFAGQGFLNTLVGILRGGQQTSAAGAENVQRSQVSQASKRVISAAKRPS